MRPPLIRGKRLIGTSCFDTLSMFEVSNPIGQKISPKSQINVR
jgi:hypothetical protein